MAWPGSLAAWQHDSPARVVACLAKWHPADEVLDSVGKYAHNFKRETKTNKSEQQQKS